MSIHAIKFYKQCCTESIFKIMLLPHIVLINALIMVLYCEGEKMQGTYIKVCVDKVCILCRNEFIEVITLIFLPKALHCIM